MNKTDDTVDFVYDYTDGYSFIPVLTESSSRANMVFDLIEYHGGSLWAIISTQRENVRGDPLYYFLKDGNVNIDSLPEPDSEVIIDDYRDIMVLNMKIIIFARFTDKSAATLFKLSI